MIQRKARHWTLKMVSLLLVLEILVIWDVPLGSNHLLTDNWNVSLLNAERNRSKISLNTTSGQIRWLSVELRLLPVEPFLNILKTWQPKKIKKGVHCVSDGSNKNPSNPVTPSTGGGFGGGANNAAAWADIAPEGTFSLSFDLKGFSPLKYCWPT